MNTQITEDYVSFETAKLLKEKGFDGPVLFTINDAGFQQYPKNLDFEYLHNSELSANRYACPTIQMAMKWLREVHKININILYDAQRFVKTDGTTEDVDVYEVDIITKNGSFYIGNYNHHESACEAAIKYCLENLMNK